MLLALNMLRLGGSLSQEESSSSLLSFQNSIPSQSQTSSGQFPAVPSQG